jgi:xanthine/uracil permease
MFLWSGRQAVFVLVMLVACVMALTHPVWQYWYQKIFPPLCIIMMIMALDYAMRK